MTMVAQIRTVTITTTCFHDGSSMMIFTRQYLKVSYIYIYLMLSSSMARPNEFSDLTTTSVGIERDLLKWAKSEKVNMSEVLRNALREFKGVKTEKPKKTHSKFRGLPVHIVNELRDLAIRHPFQLDRRLGEVSSYYKRKLTHADVLTLLPTF